eukprot:349824-Chlamydomonas_euryale.AAC.9
MSPASLSMYGDEQHLEEALEKVFKYAAPGSIRRNQAPVLTGERKLHLAPRRARLNKDEVPSGPPRLLHLSFTHSCGSAVAIAGSAPMCMPSWVHLMHALLLSHLTNVAMLLTIPVNHAWL